MLKQHNQLMLFMLKLFDIVVLGLAWIAAYIIRYQCGKLGITQHAIPPVKELLSPIVFSFVLIPLVFSYLGLYSPRRTKAFFMEVLEIVRAVVITWCLLEIFINFTRDVMISRLFMFSLLVSWIILAVLFRLSVKWMLAFLRLHGKNLRYAAIVGTGQLGQKLFHSIRHNSWTGIEVQYFVDDSDKRPNLLGRKVVGPIDQIDEIITQQPVDMVFIALSHADSHKINKVLGRLESINTDVKFIPDLLSYRFLKHDITQLDELSIISLTHSPYYSTTGLFKRIVDIVLSIVAIIIFAIPMMLIALTIKFTSKGPVLFRQQRSSMGGKTFYMLKFRTMRPDTSQNAAAWTTPNDSRITTVGKFLRRTSLDELPQLFNVLLGQMSLVGPRPELPELVERFRSQIPRYMRRGQIKAGMTGWAQVYGYRGNTSLRKRIQYDLYYIRNWSLGLDIWILFLTIFRGFINKNAY